MARDWDKQLWILLFLPWWYAPGRRELDSILLSRFNSSFWIEDKGGKLFENWKHCANPTERRAFFFIFFFIFLPFFSSIFPFQKIHHQWHNNCKDTETQLSNKWIWSTFHLIPKTIIHSRPVWKGLNEKAEMNHERNTSSSVDAEEVHEEDAYAAVFLNVTLIGCVLLSYCIKKYRIYYIPERWVTISTSIAATNEVLVTVLLNLDSNNLLFIMLVTHVKIKTTTTVQQQCWWEF